MSTPYFTVYVPFHNAEYADAAQIAVASLECQNFHSFETIVIANGFQIPDWCRRGGFMGGSTGMFGRKLIAGAFHTLSSAANAATKLAQGRWIVRLDADDQFVDHALSTYAQTIERADRPNIAVEGHWYDPGPVLGGELVLPTEQLKAVGGYDEDAPLNDGMRIVEKMKLDLVRTQEPVYAYNKRPRTMSQF